MRAARSAEQDVKGVSDKGDIGCAADQTASFRICLNEGRLSTAVVTNAVGIDLGDARASDATHIRPNTRSLFAAANRRVRSADSPFGNIKVAIGPKLQAARII